MLNIFLTQTKAPAHELNGPQDFSHPLIPLCAWGDNAIETLDICSQFQDLLTLTSGCKTFNFDDKQNQFNR